MLNLFTIELAVGTNAKYDDWAVGQFARALGKDALAKQFNERGYWWKNVIDKETGYARLKDSKGAWKKNFDPIRDGANHEYTEGHAWQLTYFVPQDVPALIEAIGRDRFLERLEQGFAQSETFRFNAPRDQYWDYPVVQGNQQSMHFAYLFNWAGKPWLTQKWSRSIMDRYYGRGETFTIEAKNTSRKNRYVQKSTLNGKPLNTFHFPASKLLKGGSLILEMGDTPANSFPRIGE